MDYKKEYEAMVQRARELHEAGNFLTKKQMEIVCPQLAESEDERIRKAIVCGMNVLKEQKKETFAAVPINDCLAWLEKQKDILGERAKNITANMFEDGIKGIQRELIEFLSNTVNASWVDIIRSADAYAERIRNTIKKQKEQEHPDGCFTCDEYKKGYEEGRRNGFTAGYNKAMKEIEQKEQKPWKVGANAYFTPEQKPSCWDSPVMTNEMIMGEQKPAEWSEEDELMILTVIQTLETLGGRGTTGMQIDWLKSLRPSWKPSEEQMEALKYVNEFVFLKDSRKMLGLKTLYEQLKKL